jgi:alginate O-acetyltransferase complex protein AlgI
MLLGGLWHGASWNFVVWGAIHGGALAWERWRGEQRRARPNHAGGPAPRVLGVASTFFVVLVAWVFFRTSDLSGALAHLRSLAGLGQAQPGADLLGGVLYQPYYLLCFALAALVTWTAPAVWDWTQHLTWPKALVCLGLFWLSLVLLATQAYNPFIYFIF